MSAYLLRRRAAILAGLAAGGGGDFSSIVLARPDLVGYWPMQETSGGTMEDVSELFGDGAYNGSITYALAGPGGDLTNSIETDSGTGDHATITNLAAAFGTTQPQTFEVCRYIVEEITSSTSSTTDGAVVGMTFDGNIVGLGRLGSSSSAVSGEVINVAEAGRMTAFGSFTLSAGWHHFMFTYSGTANGWKCYVDGAAISFVDSAGGGARGLNSGSLTIGRNAKSSSGYNGYAHRAAGLAAYDAELTAGDALESAEALGLAA